VENILIDTDIVIEYLKSKDKSSTDMIGLMQEHDLFLSSISEFELYLGAKKEDFDEKTNIIWRSEL
jgi:predicted nucleic acid-binding protein